MKWPISMMLMGAVLGMTYGKLATLYQWYLPANWLADLTRTSNVETRMDLAYISLYAEAALAGFLLWMVLRLVRR